MKFKPFLLLAVMVLNASGVVAATLAQKEMIGRDKVAVAEYAKRVNQTCGTHIIFSIDYDSFDAAGGVDTVKHAPNFLLMNAGDAIMNICKSEAGKAAVLDKIKEVRCVYTDGEEESLANGVFTYKIGYKGGNVDNPEKWLKSHL